MLMVAGRVDSTCTDSAVPQQWPVEMEYGGWRQTPARLSVSSHANATDLKDLLRCLAAEDCAHSWKSFGTEGTADELLRWENELRPSRLFFFYLDAGTRRQLVGAGAVADTLAHGFPHAGFCVVGRCYVMPAFRGSGFYRRMLHYRLERCREKFGNELNAVHLGTSSRKVERVVTTEGLPGWPRFICVGKERLTVGGHVEMVAAYMSFLPAFLQRLCRSLEDPGVPEVAIELRNCLGALERGDARDLGNAVKDLFEDERGQAWLSDHNPRELKQLMAFFRAIPLAGMSSCATE
jgi:GNAT superfamily N-acetyltransferase